MNLSIFKKKKKNMFKILKYTKIEVKRKFIFIALIIKKTTNY